MKEKEWKPDFDSLLMKKMPVMQIFNLQLNSDAVEQLQKKGEEVGLKKSSLARLAINYALADEEFLKVAKNLQEQQS